MNGVPEAVLLEPPQRPGVTQSRTRSKARAAQPVAPAPAAQPAPDDGVQLLLLALAGMGDGGLEDGALAGAAPPWPLPPDGEVACGLERVRRLQQLGHVLGREELAVLLRARLAEQLLKAGTAAELAALLRVFDKIPERADRLAEQAQLDNSSDNQPDGFELTGLDLATSIAEARRLLAEIEAETGAAADPLPPAACGLPSAGDRPGRVPGAGGTCRRESGAAGAGDDGDDGEAEDE